jgi:CAAX protease family protein
LEPNEYGALGRSRSMRLNHTQNGASVPPAPPPPATWRAIEAVPVFAIAFLSTALAAGILTAANASCRVVFVVAELVQEAAFVGAVLVWIKYVNRGPVSALGLPRRPAVDLAAGVGAGAALVIIGSVAFVLVQWLSSVFIGHTPRGPQQVPLCVHGAWLVGLAPIVVLGAPLGEETFFRGFLYRAFRRRMGPWPAAAVSGMIFGITHFAGIDYLLLIPALSLVGVGLAWVYERRQSLLASVAAHATFNLVGFFLVLHR